jgi:hypothetical protein
MKSSNWRDGLRCWCALAISENRTTLSSVLIIVSLYTTRLNVPKKK